METRLITPKSEIKIMKDKLSPFKFNPTLNLEINDVKFTFRLFDALEKFQKLGLREKLLKA